MCTETWLGPEDQPPPLQGYVAFHFPRQGLVGNNRRAARGGIAVYVCQRLARHTSVWRTAAFGTHAWVRVGKEAGLTAPLMLAACYIPPQSGNAHAKDIADVWDALAADVAAAQAEGAVLLAGDFNARTATLQDWNEGETDDAAHNGALLDVVLCEQDGLVQPPVCSDRCNQDSTVNRHGRELISLCRSTDLRICNGRTPGDLTGTCTCFPLTGGKSTVDYFLACPALMPHVRHLSVRAPEVGFDHSSLRLQLDCMTPAAGGQEGGREGSGNAPVVHPGYRVVQNRIPAFVAHLVEASNGGLVEQLREEANQAASGTQLDTLVGRLETAFHLSLRAAGMPELRLDAQAGQLRHKRHHVTAGERQLLRQRRKAHRAADFTMAARLHRELLRLRRQRMRQDKAARQAALAVLARADRSAFWKRWKQRLRTEGPIAAEDFFSYFRGLFGNAPTALTPSLTHAPPAGPTLDTPAAPHPDNSALNQPFTEAEVLSGIDALQQRKSVLGFLKLDFLKPVAPFLAPAMAAMFNACARLQTLPRAWALGAITPLLKPGGNATDCGSYRGITVGTLLAKLYATILNMRLTAWAEDNNLRATGQAGFRKDHHTSDQIFVLRTLIEQQRLAGNPLYVCFVDFQKAYDTVPRDQLWGKLDRMGINGFILDAIKALYNDVPVCVRTRGGLTSTFQSLMGVKQGCPLSPTLFGLYIDDLESDLLRQSVGLYLPTLGGEAVPPLLYADDLALMSTTREGLQRQLNFLGDYADRWGLTVNVPKTKAVVFTPPRKHAQLVANAQFTYKRDALATVESFRYLGVELHGAQPFGAAAKALAASGNKAVHAMRRRCAELGITSPSLTIELFDSLVRPVLSYGSEVWATQFLAGSDNPCESIHLSFLRRTLGVRAGTPNMVVLAEFGRFPLTVMWGKLVARFWSRLVCMDDARLMKKAFNVSLQLAARVRASYPAAHRPWASQAVQLFGALGIPMDLQAPSTVGDAHVERAMMARQVQSLAACDKCKVQHYVTAVRGGVSLCSYRPAAYLDAVADRQRRSRLAQLRTGSHWLRVETGRWQKQPREERVCSLCEHAAVEDVEHLVFDCPFYEGLRQRFNSLFAVGGRELHVFLSHDPVRVAQFVQECYNLYMA